MNFPNDSRNAYRNMEINIKYHEMRLPLNQNLRFMGYNLLLYFPNSRNETFAFPKMRCRQFMLGLPRTGYTYRREVADVSERDVDRPLLPDHSPIVAVHR
jgi:hypothetical protein